MASNPGKHVNCKFKSGAEKPNSAWLLAKDMDAVEGGLQAQVQARKSLRPGVPVQWQSA